MTDVTNESEPNFAPVIAPQSKADLAKLGGRLGNVQRSKAGKELRKTEAVAKLIKPYDKAIANLAAEEDAILDAIINYAIAHKDELVENGSQSIKLATVEIQWKLDGKGTLIFVSSEDDIIAKLERIKDGREFVAVTKKVKKDPVKDNAVILNKLGPMVAVEYGESITVTSKPTPALAKRGAKKISRTRKI